MFKKKLFISALLGLIINERGYANTYEAESMDSLFEAAHTKAITKLNVEVVQRLTFEGESYYTIPTVGDGDCFFHAVFTKIGQSYNDVLTTAEQMRKKFFESVRNEEAKLNDLRPLVFQKYKELLLFDPNDPNVPESIRVKNDEKNNLINLIDQLKQVNNGELSEDLRDMESEDNQIPDDVLSFDIPEEELIRYLERYKTNDGTGECYITINHETKSIGEMFAEMEGVNINIFTFNDRNKVLQLLKEIRKSESKEVVHVLLHGLHFMRLYKHDGSEESCFDCEQIYRNFLSINSNNQQFY